MPLDPAARGLLDQMAEAGLPPLNEMTPADAREAAKGFAELGGEGEAVADVTNRTFPGPASDVPVRIYTPMGAESGKALPCLVYFHGGGWVIGDLDMVDSVCRAVANRAGAKVVSVDYRMAPEHKFPAPLDDCYAAVEWVVREASELGVDPGRVAVGGDSAGGNLSAAVALRARDENGPALALQLLIYPVTDHGYETASYADNAEGYLLTKDMMKWFWDHYLTGPGDSENPWVSPLRAKDLSGLPPAVVFTAEYDPLRDEGEAYADRLADAGVPVMRKQFPSQIHGFWSMLAVFEASKEAVEASSGELRKAFAGAYSAR